jgi:hypothetical protein
MGARTVRGDLSVVRQNSQALAQWAARVTPVPFVKSSSDVDIDAISANRVPRR